jgi:hypothetical protein
VFIIAYVVGAILAKINASQAYFIKKDFETKSKALISMVSLQIILSSIRNVYSWVWYCTRRLFSIFDWTGIQN